MNRKKGLHWITNPEAEDTKKPTLEERVDTLESLLKTLFDTVSEQNKTLLRLTSDHDMLKHSFDLYGPIQPHGPCDFNGNPIKIKGE